MKPREFTVQVSRRVEQVGIIEIFETSAQRARVVAEHVVRTEPNIIGWQDEVIRPTQVKSEIIED